MADKSADLQRAVDVCRRVAHNGDVLLYDLRNVCAALQLEEAAATDALVSNGMHVVEYISPGFEAFRTASASESVRQMKRAATFAQFRGR